MILVRVPYNLRVDDEVKIYEKLLHEGGLGDVHIAPYTLQVASLFAILTRLEMSKKSGMNLMKKLKLYNGEVVEGFSAQDVRELQEEAQREGMIGISPLCIRNLHRVFLALSRSDGPARRCRKSCAGTGKAPPYCRIASTNKCGQGGAWWPKQPGRRLWYTPSHPTPTR